MFFALTLDENGRPDKSVAPSELTDNAFMELSVRNRLCCETCLATATRVRAHSFDGGIKRQAHFRATHKEDCLEESDPRETRTTETCLAALQKGVPSLISVGFDVQFKRTSLGLEFNPLVNSRETGLWEKSKWAEAVKKDIGRPHISVPAHNVDDILYYLELAKTFGGEQSGYEGEQRALSNLWFNTSRIVQSCSRFVVRDDEYKAGRVLQQLIDRAMNSVRPLEIIRKDKHDSEVSDAPRLFLFHTSKARDTDEEEPQKLHLLYGQAVDAKLRVNHLRRSGTASHILKMGMRFGEGLNKHNVSLFGDDLWVVGVPAISRRRAFAIVGKVLGDVKRVEPAFCYLSVKQPAQFTRSTHQNTPPIARAVAA
jgi:hypothetical protein